MVSIDLLRGVAVLLVVMRHLPFSWRATPSAGPPVDAIPAVLASVMHYGEYGVHLFLVLSGYCIHMRWARRFDLQQSIDFVPFWKRRLHRLYPPYLATLLLSLAGLYLLFGVFGGAHESIAARFGYSSSQQLAIDIVFLLLLAQNLNGASARIGNTPYWSLALEEQLYMLYFPLLRLRRKYGWTATLVVVAATTLLWRIVGAVAFPSPPGFWFVVGPALWLPWALGAISVEAHLGHITLPRWTRSLPTFAVVGLLAVLSDPPPQAGFYIRDARVLSDLLFAGACWVLVNWLGELERTTKLPQTLPVSALAAIGLWSYSIYLCHTPALLVAKELGLRFGLGAAAILVLRAILGVLAGYVFFMVVERRFLSSSRPTAATQTALVSHCLLPSPSAPARRPTPSSRESGTTGRS